MILILEDDLDLARTFQEMINILTNERVLIVHSFSDLQSNREIAISCSVAILDIDLGNGPSGIDAYQWLCAQGFHGKIAFLTGHAKSHPLVSKAAAMGSVQVLAKPIGINEILKLVSER